MKYRSSTCPAGKIHKKTGVLHVCATRLAFLFSSEQIVKGYVKNL